MRWTWEYLGTTRTLHDNHHPIYIPDAGCCQLRVVRDVNVGMPPNVNELEDRVQQGAGRIWLFNYLEARRPRLTLSIFGENPTSISADDLTAARRILAQWFNPQPSAPDGILTYYDRNSIVRSINARYDGGLEYDWVYTDQGEFLTEVVFLCADPLFYDPVQQQASWAQSGVTGIVACFDAPFVACEGVETSQALTNAGDWATYPIIEITGPAANVSIINSTTGEEIRATYTLAAGKIATYDLTPGVKTVTDSDGNNLISDLLQPNDLATFHLACAYEYNDDGAQIAPGGVNNITITSTTGAASAVVTWYNRYLSS